MARVDPLFYHDLTRTLRSSVIAEVASGRYVHLKNPNNRSRGSSSVQDITYRFSILARPVLPLTGVRSLSIGSTEIALVLQGVVPRDATGCAGITFDARRAHYRFIFGSKSACTDFKEAVFDAFSHSFGKSKLHLYRGNYGHFVHTALGMVNDNLDIFKQFLNEPPSSVSA
ncbi:hypothetical protein EXS73_01575 [Candidatus Pacearchaeota archaeon]|nr:hypothetical protein [Candidatus Pacearchaeota archaeon]